MPADTIPFHGAIPGASAGDPTARSAEDIAHTYTSLLARYAVDLDIINRDACACRSTDDMLDIQKRTLDITTSALDAVAKLCNHLIDTYAGCVAPDTPDRG